MLKTVFRECSARINVSEFADQVGFKKNRKFTQEEINNDLIITQL